MQGAVAGLGVVVGLVLGSYAVTSGLRLAGGAVPRGLRSRCDACDAPLSFVETAPVVAFIGLRGACRHCRARIDPVHLLGEVVGALVVTIPLMLASPWRAALLGALGLVLLAAATVDLKVQRLPDGLTAAAAGITAALAATRGAPALVAGALAALLTAVALLLLRAVGRSRRGDPGLGLGDVKLLAALALWLGAATPIAVVVACGLGLAAVPMSRASAAKPRPFGPMIALAAWTVGLALEGGWRPWGL